MAGDWEQALAQLEETAAAGLWDEVCDGLPELLTAWADQGKPEAIAAQLAQIMRAVVSLGDMESRRMVSRLWRRLGMPGISVLREILLDPEEEFHGRWLAGRSLGEMGASGMTEARDVVLALLADQQDEETMAIASGAITHMGAPAIEVLSELLNQPETRPAALRSLVKICHPAIVTPLLTVMDDPEPQLRATALEAISNFQDPRSLPLLLTALEDTASVVRRETVRGLGQKAKMLAQQGDVGELAKLEGILVARLQDFSIDVCQQAATALGRLQTTTALKALTQTLHRDTTPVPLRKTIIQALVWSDHPDALEHLGDYLGHCSLAPTDTDQLETLQTLMQMLGRITGNDGRSHARNLVEKFWHRSLQDGQGIPEQDLSDPLREAIAQTLGQLRQSTSRPILQTLANDPIPSVRYRAEAALRMIPQA